ncbi:uncharacterized protein BDR25DRAFT_352473 [Lindgomyces ingoldianus]|uniref:Uncharacterized protein n=1 Tax=Lindgomyces ingoldianus TaxID=673940 RepID=A0ACB6R6S2_9PLEO|nr:uncharacterized protein BDR25DRAFT_352473 [Lindgomyces ingoldianus]KAF2474007.1 hypothetical protein BDR25DRAFT_352473 [Lindgomyces ingoldianus]
MSGIWGGYRDTILVRLNRGAFPADMTPLSKRAEGSPYIHRASEHNISTQVPGSEPQPRLSVYATDSL